MTSVLIVGLGGQGVITASDILAVAAAHEGLEVKKSEIHGMSQRGGSVFSFVRFADKVFSPVPPKGAVDILLAFELTEALRWRSSLSEKGTCFTVNMHIPPLSASDRNIAQIQSDVESWSNSRNVHIVEPQAIRGDGVGVSLPRNTAMLGVIKKLIPLSDDSWYKAISSTVPSHTVNRNERAFAAGEKWARENLP